MAKEDIVLDLSVDQGSMITELEKTKSVIIGLKKEQQDLTKAYKSGVITQEEYAKELVRVESLLKTQQSTYNNTQKAVTGVKTKMDDLIASNNKLASSVKTSTENIRVGGVTVGELGTKIASLANPVTAAVVVVGALGAAYARSSIGAKDLEFSSHQLSAATTILTDRFASLFSSVEDGEGALSKATDNFLFVLDVFTLGSFELADSAKRVAQAQENLNTITEEAGLIQAKINERLSDNAELMTDLTNAETSLNDKKRIGLQIQDNISDNASDKLEILNKELKAWEQLNIAKDTGDNDKERNRIEAQITAITAQESKQREKIEKLLNAAVNAENKRLELQKEQQIVTDKKIKAQEEASEKELRNREVSFSDDPLSGKEFDPQEQFEKDKQLIDDTLGLTVTAEDKKRAELLRTNALKDELLQADRDRFQEQAQLMEDNFNTLAGLFSQGSEARKIFALAGIGTDTASAIASLTAMSEANPANSVTFGGAGIAQYAAGLIRIFANIVAAKEFLGASLAGGADFVTSKPTMIMVGDNPGNIERVTVQPLSGRGKSTFNKSAGLASFAGGGSMTFDPQSSSASNNINQALATSNAIKRMPQPEVSVKEITKVQRRITVKENISKQ